MRRARIVSSTPGRRIRLNPPIQRTSRTKQVRSVPCRAELRSAARATLVRIVAAAPAAATVPNRSPRAGWPIARRSGSHHGTHCASNCVGRLLAILGGVRPSRSVRNDADAIEERFENRYGWVAWSRSRDHDPSSWPRKRGPRHPMRLTGTHFATSNLNGTAGIGPTDCGARPVRRRPARDSSVRLHFTATAKNDEPGRPSSLETCSTKHRPNRTTTHEVFFFSARWVMLRAEVGLNHRGTEARRREEDNETGGQGG